MAMILLVHYIMHIKKKKKNRHTKLFLHLESETIKLPSAQDSLPIVLDINGDMKTDILGYSKDTNELSIWMNTALSESTNTSSLFNL